MARPAKTRAPLVPRSAQQRDRRDRVLRVASHLVSTTGLEGLQMTDVAKEADVGIATLYRYFPSKTHLMVAVQAQQVERFAEQVTSSIDLGTPRETLVADALVDAARSMLRRPLLGSALVLSSNIANPAAVPDVTRIDSTFRQMIMTLLGIDDPTQRDVTAVRLLLQVWHGVVMAALNGRMSFIDAESDVRLAAEVLLPLRSSGSGQPPTDERPTLALGAAGSVAP
ncbi:TetR family transcriptional regulator [Pimelobacter simplex]|uniref:TetR family transcriptional regulator n=1 Tax=Nocardioides simplex TaxID=2045 RepID=UPI001934991F|nr:TetR family transcriptional regulator [Pimelobacter simplex]